MDDLNKQIKDDPGVYNVLLPLRDIAPSWVHPATGLDVAQMIAALPPGQDAVPEENLDTRAA